MEDLKREASGLDQLVRNLIPAVVGYKEKPPLILDAGKRKLKAGSFCDIDIIRRLNDEQIERNIAFFENKIKGTLVEINDNNYFDIKRMVLEIKVVSSVDLVHENEALKEKNLQLEKKSKLQSALVISLAAALHDTKGLLTPMLLALSELRKGLSNTDLIDDINFARQAVDQISARSTDALTICKSINKERVDLLKVVVPLFPLIDKSVVRWEKCRVRFLQGDDILVNVDDVHLGRAIMNLLDNAVKFSGGVADEVYVLINYDKEAFTVIVSDKGRGIDSESDIFALNERGSGASSVAGFGVGLAYCKMVCEFHGGSIKGENNPDGGARFTMTIPRK